VPAGYNPAALRVAHVEAEAGMTIRCVGCGRAIQIPDDKAGNPRLKIKCACGALFPLQEASIAVAPPAASPAAPAPPAPSTPARPPAVTTPMVAPRVPVAAPVPAARIQAPPPPIRPAARVPVPPSPVSFQATVAVAGDAPALAARPGAWKMCGSHPDTRSEFVCTSCLAGYCRECGNRVRNAVLCTSCETLCIRSADYQERLDRERQRAQPMMSQLGTIVSYPLRDPMAYVMLAVVTWIFTALGSLAVLHGKMAAILLSQGILMAYCFTALSRVSSGNMKDYMPDIGDVTDLARSLRLGATALIAGSGPLFLVVLLIPGLALFGGMGKSAPEEPPPAMPGTMMSGTSEMADPAPGGEEEEGLADPSEEPAGESGRAGEAASRPGTPALGMIGLALGALILGGLALLWKIIYTPVALTVAGLSRSSLSTLNPVVAFDTIKRMGGVYWQAMGIYTVVALTQWVMGFTMSFIPILGGLVQAFVDAYAYLVIGCTLGLAVFKKAPELGLE
jgi:hypothetical protein